MDQTSKDLHGRKYFLCKTPSEASARSSSFRVCSKPLEEIINNVGLLIIEATKGQSYTTPSDAFTEAGIRNIYNEACDMLNVLEACKESGISMERPEWDELKMFLARRNDRERKEREANMANSHPKKEKQSLADLFSEKGWSVKQ